MSRYKKYERYKDSGIVWIGEIPEEWEVVKIKRLTRVKRGASPRPIDDPIYFDDDGEYSWVRISDVTASKMYLNESMEKFSVLGASLSVKLNPGQLFISICATVGKPCITKIKCCIHDGFVYFPDFKGDNRFLYYIFEAGEAYKGLGKLGTQLNLNTDTVGGITIGLPSINEQESIANFLDHKTSEIDGLIADKEKLIELLQEKRQAIISEAVTKGLNPNVKMKDSGIEWIGEIPEYWKIVRLKFLKKTPFQYGANESAEMDDPQLPRYIRITDINERGDLKEDTFKSLSWEIAQPYLLKDGNILFARSGATVGKTFIYKEKLGVACFAGYLIKFEPDKNKVNSYYIYYYTLSKIYEDWIKQSTIQATIQNVSAEKYGNLHVPLPPLEEQKMIVNHLNDKIEEIDILIKSIYMQIQKLKEYRQSLISEAVTGKIDVRNYAVG